MDYREDARDDYYDHWDDHHHGYWDDNDDEAAAFLVGAAVGAAAAAPAYTSTTTVIYALPCGASQVIVSGSYYYQCGSTWYSRANQGGSVVYVVSGPAY